MKILLTGATGFIGGAVLAQAIEGGAADCQWICLVRGSDEAAAARRVAVNLRRFKQHVPAGLEIVAGDLLDPTWTRDPRLADVTHVLHLAADTSWWAHGRVHRTNHDGTLKLARWATRLPKLQRFLYVGTAMICGGNPPALVREDDFPSDAAEHLVSYSASKAAAERSLGAMPDLPLVVARPSIVVGHTTLGSGPSASILWMFRAADRLRLVGCDLRGTVDVVPADWAAGALLHLLQADRLDHRVYHLSAGLAARASWSGLARAFEDADPAGGARHYDRLQPHDTGLLRRRFAAAFGLDDPQRIAMLKAMRSYYRFCELSVTFDNDRIRASGFRAPPCFSDYLSTCLASDTDIPRQFLEDRDMLIRPDDAEAPVTQPSVETVAP